MLAEQKASTPLEARCPGCRDAYQGAILPFLYADEFGSRCPTCGDVLVVGRGSQPGEPGPCRLLLPEELDGSGLHGKLSELAGRAKGLRIQVGRMGRTRTVRPESRTERASLRGGK